VSPKASQSGFSHTKPESMTFEVSAGSAVTPQEGQIGARSMSASSLMRVIIPGAEQPTSMRLEGALWPRPLVVRMIRRWASRPSRRSGFGCPRTPRSARPRTPGAGRALSLACIIGRWITIVRSTPGVEHRRRHAARRCRADSLAIEAFDDLEQAARAHAHLSGFLLEVLATERHTPQ